MRNKLMDGLSVFLKDPRYRNYYTVNDAKTYLVYPLDYGRMKIFYKEGEPVGLVSWAFLTPEREKEFQHGASLKKEDFENTEGNLWGVDFISEDNSAKEMLRYLRKLKDRLYPSQNKVRFLRYKTNNKLHEMRF